MLNDMTTVETITISLSGFSIIVAFFSYLAAAKSAKQAAKSTAISEVALKRASYEKVQSLPSIEVIGALKVDNQIRVKLLVFNLRQNPLRVHCVKVLLYQPKPINITNYIKSKMGPFDWDYSKIEDVVWNPKGTLDDREHYLEDAIEFSYVKEKEYLLVTMPSYSEGATYKFVVITSIGECFISSRPSFTGRTMFAIDYNQTIT